MKFNLSYTHSHTAGTVQGIHYLTLEIDGTFFETGFAGPLTPDVLGQMVEKINNWGENTKKKGFAFDVPELKKNEVHVYMAVSSGDYSRDLGMVCPANEYDEKVQRIVQLHKEALELNTSV